MSYQVELSRSAATYLRRLDKTAQARIVDRLEEIAQDPYGPYMKPLTNLPGKRASRVGGYRIVFNVDEEAKIVRVSDIGPRGQIYHRL